MFAGAAEGAILVIDRYSGYIPPTNRAWKEWVRRCGKIYVPRRNRGTQGHRSDSQMVAVVGEALTPEDALDPSQRYVYS